MLNLGTQLFPQFPSVITFRERGETEMPEHNAIIVELARSFNRQTEVIKLSHYRDDIESIYYSLSCFSSAPCIAWNNILRLNRKYKKELNILYDYYPYSHIWIVPEVLITNALILSNLNKLLFILPRCMLLKEIERASCA